MYRRFVWNIPLRVNLFAFLPEILVKPSNDRVQAKARTSLVCSTAAGFFSVD